jgi:hypothetical protein
VLRCLEVEEKSNMKGTNRVTQMIVAQLDTELRYARKRSYVWGKGKRPSKAQTQLAYRHLRKVAEKFAEVVGSRSGLTPDVRSSTS